LASASILDDISSIQSVALTPDGDAFVTVDLPDGNGGIIRANGLADELTDSEVGMGNNFIAGDATYSD
jgi:hypothetical protein